MISIVVCTHNGKSRLIPCLASIIAQEAALKFEILVVDNASTDGTGDLVREFLGKEFSSGDWKVLEEHQPGLLHARIKGMQSAQFEWILFCDDDNILFSDFLCQCKKILSLDKGIGVLGSHGIPEFLGPKPEWFERYFSSYAVGPQLRGGKIKEQLVHVYGACSIFRKQPLLELFRKGFIPALSDRKGAALYSGGDVEWCWLMQLLGYQVIYSDNLKFYHQLPASRLTWGYYLRLKQGISGTAGLLYPYQYYFMNSFRSRPAFYIFYMIEVLKSVILFLKHKILWKGNPSDKDEQLALAILEARKKAFSNQKEAAINHFQQLKQFFGP